MKFGVLGQLLVHDGTVRRLVPAPKQRVLLATLILSANHPVSVDHLADLVWDGSPPPSWRAALHNHVNRLRRTIGPAGARLVTSFPGYQLEVHDAESDLMAFETLSRAAQAAVVAGAWERTGAPLRAALNLWRGTPLGDVPCEPLRGAWVPALTERWLQLVEWRIESDLRSGHDPLLVGELRQLVGAHPLRERFHCQLMTVLCRTGRQAEALAVYQDARRLLNSELGIEPGFELRQAHQRVLSGESFAPGTYA
jgi:DNA-binding SARP family transcriptional activator